MWQARRMYWQIIQPSQKQSTNRRKLENQVLAFPITRHTGLFICSEIINQLLELISESITFASSSSSSSSSSSCRGINTFLSLYLCPVCTRTPCPRLRLLPVSPRWDKINVALSKCARTLPGTFCKQAQKYFCHICTSPCSRKGDNSSRHNANTTNIQLFIKT